MLLKREKTVFSDEPQVCKNCETHFKGNYCPACGQSVKELDKPFSIIVYDFLGNIFAFDTRFYKSLATLFLKPGFLTSEFFDGRRVRYAPPFRFYVFVSFILFLLLQIYTNRSLTSALDASVSAENKTAADSILNSRLPVNAKSLSTLSDSVSGNNLNLDFNGVNLSNIKNLRQGLDGVAEGLERQLKNETNPRERARLRKQIGLARSPEQAIAKIFKSLSWAFFILLPLFAFILSLFYARHKYNYIRHLIFSIHFHSFLFIVFIIIVSLVMIFPTLPNFVVLVLLLCIPIYFFLALKKFYNQGWLKSVLKFFGASVIYNIIVSVAVSIAFLNALRLI